MSIAFGRSTRIRRMQLAARERRCPTSCFRLKERNTFLITDHGNPQPAGLTDITRQSGSLPISRQGSHASGSPFIPTRRGSSSLADPQLRIDMLGVSASRSRSTSLGSRIIARPVGAARASLLNTIQMVDEDRQEVAGSRRPVAKSMS